ncbi:hypothetical protein OIU78_030405 [Salix suchowensis]|nr:hypothetical protein OIU78_030405 [Salix suchowensis]
MDTTPRNDGFHASTDIGEPATRNSSMRVSNRDITSFSTWEKFNAHSTGMKTDDDNNTIALSTGELSMLDEGKKIDKESSSSVVSEGGSPHISAQFQVNNMRSICSSTSSSMDIPPHSDAFHAQTSTDIGEPATLNASMGVNNTDITSFSTWEKFTAESTRIKNALAQDYLRLLNTADKEVLKKLKGIGEKRANYILELREDSPEPFKNLDDLKVIGLSAKQVCS